MVHMLRMKTADITIARCHATCPRCSIAVEFRMFENGPDGEFKTLFGRRTGSYYRVSLQTIQNSPKVYKRFLKEAVVQEGGRKDLVEIPGRLQCSSCKKRFYSEHSIFVSDDTVRAYFLD